MVDPLYLAIIHGLAWLFPGFFLWRAIPGSWKYSLVAVVFAALCGPLYPIIWAVFALSGWGASWFAGALKWPGIIGIPVISILTILFVFGGSIIW